MLKHLRENVYCRLAPSTVHGVGVFAVRDIPAGVDPFRPLEPMPEQRFDLTDAQMQRNTVPAPVIGLVHEFFFRNDDRRRSYPVCDPNQFNISFYLNHGGAVRANVAFQERRTAAHNVERTYDPLVTTRMIKAGEELLLDYYADALYADDKFAPLSP